MWSKSQCNHEARHGTVITNTPAPQFPPVDTRRAPTYAREDAPKVYPIWQKPCEHPTLAAKRLGASLSAKGGKLYCQCPGTLASLNPTDAQSHLLLRVQRIPGYEGDSTRAILAQARTCSQASAPNLRHHANGLHAWQPCSWRPGAAFFSARATRVFLHLWT